MRSEWPPSLRALLANRNSGRAPPGDHLVHVLIDGEFSRIRQRSGVHPTSALASSRPAESSPVLRFALGRAGVRVAGWILVVGVWAYR